MDALGMVRVDAQRRGNQLNLWAIGEGGLVLGRAFTFTGLSVSEIYVNTPSGLGKVRIL